MSSGGLGPEYPRTYRIRRGWRLELAPWGPQLEPETTSVSHFLFRRVTKDAEVYVLLHEGALGLRWFQVSLTRAEETP